MSRALTGDGDNFQLTDGFSSHAFSSQSVSFFADHKHFYIILHKQFGVDDKEVEREREKSVALARHIQ